MVIYENFKTASRKKQNGGYYHRMIDRVLFLVTAGADADTTERRERFFMAASPD